MSTFRLLFDETCVATNRARVWRCTGVALLAAFLAVFSVNAKADVDNQPSVAIYYGNDVPVAMLDQFDWAVVESEHMGEGQLDALELERTIADETKGPVRLVSVTHVPTSGGLVNPASAIGAVTSRHGIQYLLDACQSVGQMPVDVEEIGCDLLVGTYRERCLSILDGTHDRLVDEVHSKENSEVSQLNG